MNYRFYKTIENINNTVWIIIYILYVAILLGLLTTAPKLLPYLELFIKILTCLFLILRFNPLNHIKFSNLDQTIAFTAGFFILSTTLTNEIVIAYTSPIKNKAMEKKRKLEMEYSNLINNKQK